MRRTSPKSTRQRPSRFAVRRGFLSSLLGVELAIVLLVLVALGAALVAGAEPRPVAASQQPDRSRPIRSVTVAGADDRHVVVLTDACCYIRDVERSETYPVWMRVETERATAVAGSPAEPHLLICRDKGRLNLLHTETGETVWSSTLPAGDGASATFSPDGSMIAISTDKKEVLLIDSHSSDILHTFKVEESAHSVCFTPCGRRLVAPVTRDEVGVWDIASEREIMRFPVPGGAATSLAMHPSGKSIAVATYEGLTLLLSLADGHVEREWSVSVLPVLNVTFRPDGQELFVARCDGEVNVFSPQQGGTLRQFTAHQDAVRTMAFAGEQLVTGGYDGIVRTWNAATNSEIPLAL